MAKDYRKTRSTRSSKRYAKPAPKSKGTAGGFKWTLIGIVVGISAAIIIFWEYAPGILHKNTPSKPSRHHHAATKNAASNATGQSHAPQFDFYTLLPKTQIDSTPTSAPAAPAPPRQNIKKPMVTPEQTTPDTAPAFIHIPPVVNVVHNPLATPPVTSPPAGTPEATTPHTGKFVLQVASVKSYSEADRLKAQLSMLGFNVIIQKNTIDGRVWNRVSVGPFSSKQLAAEKQQALRENNVSSIIIKQ